jgi:cell wall-associated NlpC family hydrolase
LLSALLNNLKTGLFVFLLSLLTASPIPAEVTPPLYAVAVLPSPVLNTPDFASVFGGSDGKTLRLDQSGLIREVEFVAFPETVFHIEEILKYGDHDIYRVTTEEYPYPAKTGYFVDSRFVRTSDTLPSPKVKHLPAREKVIENLLAAKGSRYIWGGNYREGITQLLTFYPPATGSLPAITLDFWRLRGVDCSGLLYEATGGYTPRNTSSLISYGRPVPIAGLDAERIASRVEPLDLIVWSGHVMIILDRGRVIESRLDQKDKGGGVVVRPLKEALAELLVRRVPMDDYRETTNGGKGFVIRRWYPGGR